jgi:hypothetical protein
MLPTTNVLLLLLRESHASTLEPSHARVAEFLREHGLLERGEGRRG